MTLLELQQTYAIIYYNYFVVKYNHVEVNIP